MTETTQERGRPLRVLAFAGSLRRGSYNRKLLEVARELAPEGMHIEIYDLSDIPLYNGDLDTDDARPESVERFKRAIADADALLISTPEYNHSVPGVLQNAIDWASRPGGRSPLAGKLVAIMGASPGALGAARAQQQLKLVLMSTLALVMPHPGVAVGQVREKFGPDGMLVHAPTRNVLAAFLKELEHWACRVRASDGGRRAA
jgi:chromate reductase